MKFGTDGFRGPTDTKITPDFCLNLGFHTGCIIKDKGYDSVIIGKIQEFQAICLSQLFKLDLYQLVST